jgi:hypothetical protein
MRIPFVPVTFVCCASLSVYVVERAALLNTACNACHMLQNRKLDVAIEVSGPNNTPATVDGKEVGMTFAYMLLRDCM